VGDRHYNRITATAIGTAVKMLANIKKEFLNSPVSTLSALVSTVIAGVALYIAWLQFPSSSATQSNLTVNAVSGSLDVNVGNILLVVAFFVSLTVFSAILTRYVGRWHGLGATFFSITLASITNFLTIVVIYLSPPRSLDNELFINANDLVLYSSMVFYLTFCGRAALKDIFAPDSDDNTDSNGQSALIFIIILVVIWCKCVFVGQELLSETFLPEVAHPTIEKVVNNA
jgi:hypothetical protein